MVEGGHGGDVDITGAGWGEEATGSVGGRRGGAQKYKEASTRAGKGVGGGGGDVWTDTCAHGP